jgi:hypothetical protein
MRVPYYSPGGQIPPPDLVAAWYLIDDLATEQVPFWAAHWLADGMDGDALRALAGMDGSDPPAVREKLADALADTHAPIPHDIREAVTAVYGDLARLHLDGRISARWLIAKIEQLIVSADYVGDYLDQPLGATYGFDDEWSGGWGRSQDELAALFREACIEQAARRTTR